MNMASLIEVKKNPNIPDLAPGDTVKVSTKVIESGRERTQPFQGVVVRLKRGGTNANFTVRRIAYGVGVERTFPLYSPLVEKVEVIRHGKVHRAKLYYLRGRSGKAARIKERRVDREKKAAPVQNKPVPDKQETEQVQEE
ncbi:MAG: 50S ribosomal protein L19 [Dehalococcoidales bacterium]